MENKKIEIKGISRMLPQNVSEDGLSRDIINMRFWNGAWRPIGQPEEFATGVEEDMPSFIHKTTDGSDFVITYDTLTGYLKYKPLLSGEYTNLAEIGTGLTVRFSSLHNVLLTFNETDEEIYYTLYDLTEETYSYIGKDIFPDTLYMTFTESGSLENLHDPLSFDSSAMTDEEIEEKVKSDCLSLEAKSNKEGRFTGRISFIYAYELFDGSIVKHSFPIFRDAGQWQWKITGTTVYSKVMTRPLQYTIYTSAGDLAAMKATYKNIIKSVNIYINRPVNPYTPDADDLTSAYDEITRKEDSTTDDECINRTYRLVHKVAFDDLTYNSPEIINFDNIIDIETREALTVDNFTHHLLFANCNYKYNNRIFHADTKTSLYIGYPISPICSYAYSTMSAYKVWFEVDIKDMDGIKTVRSNINTFTYGTVGNAKFYVKNFAYPDSRASTLRIYVSLDEINVYLAKTLTLKKHITHNMAYYIGEEDTLWGTILIDDTLFGSPESYTYSNLPTLYSIIINRNRIQSTEVDNPFYFPAKNSYNIGLSEIVGLGSNTLLIETGQFGEYPIYIFTQDGVWAMNFAADASILIDTIKPAAMDVCTNRDSITPTPYGVVFVSYERLMIISAMKAIKISAEMEGNYLSPLKNNLGYKDIIANAQIADVEDLIDAVNFESYLNGCTFSYNYKREELILTNPSYSYSYIYGILPKQWYKSENAFNTIINYNQKIIGERGGVLYDLTEEVFSGNVGVPVFLESFPVKLGIDSFTKIEALALRGLMHCDQDNGIGLYLFGSVDGIKWVNMLSKEESGVLRDVITKRADYSACQFVVIFSGTIKEQSYLTHLDFQYKGRFENKIR